jgi:hypothetical protein
MPCSRCRLCWPASNLAGRPCPFSIDSIMRPRARGTWLGRPEPQPARRPFGVQSSACRSLPDALSLELRMVARRNHSEVLASAQVKGHASAAHSGRCASSPRYSLRLMLCFREDILDGLLQAAHSGLKICESPNILPQGTSRGGRLHQNSMWHKMASCSSCLDTSQRLCRPLCGKARPYRGRPHSLLAATPPLPG